MISRRRKEKIYFSLLKLAGIVSVGILIIIIGYIIKFGIGVIDWQFLSSMWSHRDITQGGIFPAIYGTLYLAIGIAAFSIPTGMFCAIYLNEYAKGGKFVRAVRIAIRNLAGVPSIVYGLYGFAIFVFFFGLGKSLLAAWLTLASMTLPWTITASEEALKSIPNSFREASLALGASKWQTIRKTVLPHAIPGMITGSIIGLARALGETAPLLLVGGVFYMGFLPAVPSDQFMALPYHIYILATQHTSEFAVSYAAGAAIVLISLVFAISAGMILIRRHYRKKREW
ncbi:phosphate ABC transporter permease [candidate division MSBL1 archaeon SCGC-AAA833F18]|uniref:Phosphate transport system permease protein PstA n=1 Tax=candidate division MSBL1 archaeon SCGC-AAA833F18 TaxID=1698257 RepID=A0A133VRX1_9EURY|nr:phosphate ABC transporter permease [candidate division MSBL1 archaeon SCGC-AAA833F18]